MVWIARSPKDGSRSGRRVEAIEDLICRSAIVEPLKEGLAEGR
ncbi:hypothetical protein [Kitasatospora kifunensis]|uniref:Uncharacterized protein n=1 Tax=Kitasatospora kifunensis TaxID=58351 RepID=A0A7W7VZH4_KITKI|nr:hypothetical protein [Kitasatospora kifunensis]MBB4928561.1 hypothetical protein [Kitasatospora kifunensis]